MADEPEFSTPIASLPSIGTQMGGIAETIRKARSSRGWTQNELAERAAVSRPSVARIEGGHDVNTNVLNRVLNALGLALDIRDDR